MSTPAFQPSPEQLTFFSLTQTKFRILDAIFSAGGVLALEALLPLQHIFPQWSGDEEWAALEQRGLVAKRGNRLELTKLGDAFMLALRAVVDVGVGGGPED
jgi:hypothetical protein